MTLIDSPKGLLGLSPEVIVMCNGASLREGVLITHRWISGLAALQASSHWHKGDELVINVVPKWMLLMWCLKPSKYTERSHLKPF